MRPEQCDDLLACLYGLYALLRLHFVQEEENFFVLAPGLPQSRRSVVSDRGWLTRNVRVLSAVSFLQDAASELLYPLLPIYLTAVLGAPPSVVGAIEGAAEGAASLTKLAVGPLGDRFAKRPLIATGYGMAALGKVIIAVAAAWPGVLAGRVVDRLGKGIRGAPRDALLVDGIETVAARKGFRLPPHDGHPRCGGRPAARTGRLRAAGPSHRAAAVHRDRARRPVGAARVPGAKSNGVPGRDHHASPSFAGCGSCRGATGG